MANLLKSIWNGASDIVSTSANAVVDGVSTVGNTLHVTAQTTGIISDMSDVLRNGETPLSKIMADAIISEFSDEAEPEVVAKPARRNVKPTKKAA